MNPPYSTLEPFLIRALEIAQDKLIVLCRMQVLEGEGRYEKIFKEYSSLVATHCNSSFELRSGICGFTAEQILLELQLGSARRSLHNP